nr:CRISPR-associated endoribonuclease Cas6 [Saprospiraceae bacterium]
VLLPWDYQYAVQSWIYHVLSKADSDLTTQLHDIGHTYEGKSFKLFGFYQWGSFPYKAQGSKGLLLLSDTSEITVSFLLPDILSTFISGLFIDSNYTFYFTNKISIQAQVVGVQLLLTPSFTKETIEYQLMTGARISTRENGKVHADYIGPAHEAYHEKWIQNLCNKYLASVPKEATPINLDKIKLYIHDEFRSKMINIFKNGTWIKLRVFEYAFSLHAPEELHRTLYYGGVGEECSLGLGWVEMIG